MTAGAEAIKRAVLLPGMDGTGSLFEEFIQALPEEFETAVVCYPTGAFLSYPELMSQVLAACESSEPSVLLAESFSTPLAIQYAATRPENLRGLILCAGFATSPIRGWKRWIGSLLAPVLFQLPLPSFMAERFLVGPAAPTSLLSSVQKAVASVRPKVLSLRLAAILGCDAREALGQVAVPILCLQASQDRLIPSACLEEIRRIQPQVAVATIEGPHLLLQREPQQAAEIVASFVRQLPSCRP
jgi:pimeloyl-ACP methyl ester carboxylesterase